MFKKLAEKVSKGFIDEAKEAAAKDAEEVEKKVENVIPTIVAAVVVSGIFNLVANLIKPQPTSNLHIYVHLAE